MQTTTTTAPSVIANGTELSRPTTSGPAKQRFLSDDDRLNLAKIKKNILEKHGVHSPTYLRASGFQYTGNGDTTRCDDCGLEVAGWTSTMIPFTIHAERKPDCSFVCSVKKSCKSTYTLTPSISVTRLTTTTSELENPAKHQKTDVTGVDSMGNSLFDTSVQQVRRRTFSHWPHRTNPSRAQMIAAGFFSCNVADRVICIYCNLICQQWTPDTDDPCEVHKTLSPNCIYVKSKLLRRAASLTTIVKKHATAESTKANESVPPAGSVHPTACNLSCLELPQRHASFADWPAENLPSVDDLVRAGFFYTGTKTTVTCFYCNGSLHNWGPNDNPMIEHARWFPHCAYAKQLCGDALYRKVQESKRAQQGELHLSFLSSLSILTSNI